MNLLLRGAAQSYAGPRRAAQVCVSCAVRRACVVVDDKVCTSIPFLPLFSCHLYHKLSQYLHFLTSSRHFPSHPLLYCTNLGTSNRSKHNAFVPEAAQEDTAKCIFFLLFLSM